VNKYQRHAHALHANRQCQIRLARMGTSSRHSQGELTMPTKAARIVVVAMLALASAVTLHLASAQQPGVERTELQRHDLSAPGREMIQVRVAVDPGVALPLHSHHGEEIVYVLEGTWEFQMEGQAMQTLEAGDVAFVPTGVKHWAKNVGSGTGSVLATYIVEKGKPFVIPAK
jgi:quercetin dioxygenase-like cupin family protein